MNERRMARQPTLLLVHGAWAGAWVWESVVDALRRRGVRAEAVERLPSAGRDPGQLGDLRDDADCLRDAVERLPGPAVLCGHSYGGMAITELADHPAVSHSIYLSAFWPGPARSVSDLLAGRLPEWIVDRGDGSLALSDDVDLVRRALFADLRAERAAEARGRMVLQSVASFVTPSSGPRRAHATTYVVCTEDRALPVAAQEAMAAAADSTVRLPTAHCPQLTAPEAVADALAGVCSAHVAAALTA